MEHRDRPHAPPHGAITLWLWLASVVGYIGLVWWLLARPVGGQ